MARLSRRNVVGGGVAVAALTALPAGIAAESALADYRQLMDRRASVEAATGWGAVEEWCSQEVTTLGQLTASPGGLGDLLAKVIIMADRSQANGWNMMDCEAELFASMKKQAQALLGRVAQ